MPRQLREHVHRKLAPAHASERPVDHAHHGVEVSTRHGSDGEDDRGEGRAGGERVLEELEPAISRAQPLRGDARADHCDEQHRRADELGERAPPQQQAAGDASAAQAPAPQEPSARRVDPSESLSTVYTSQGAPSGSFTHTLSCRA